jgi:hypothetical protein
MLKIIEGNISMYNRTFVIAFLGYFCCGTTESFVPISKSARATHI